MTVDDHTPPDWVTIAEAAQLIQRPAVTVRRWARQGLVGAERSGSVWLVKWRDVERVNRTGGRSRSGDLTDDPVAALKDAWQRVSRDVERDDLPDLVDHLDFGFSSEDEINRIASEIQQGYAPKPLRLIEMPKTGLTSRPLADLAIEDRLVYEACVQTIAPAMDARLHTHVFNYRVKPSSKGRFRIRPFGASFRDFQKFATLDAWISTNAQVCLVADIASFYEYVDHRTLIENLEVSPEHSGILETLERLFDSWRRQTNVVGLPQGPEASGVLGNAYLMNVDSVCAAGALAYGRYSDDLRIFFASAEDARRFGPRLIAALRTVALNLSTAKTQVKTVDELIDDVEGARRAAANYKVDAQMISSLPELQGIFDDAVKERATINGTDFRFSVWRLGLLEDPYPLSRILELLPDVAFAAQIVADYLARLGYLPQVADAVTEYILSPDNVHPWAEIQYLRLVGTFDQIEPRLLDRIRWLSQEESGPLGDFAARVLGAVGDPHDTGRLRQLATREDVAPQRRRAAVLGAGDLKEEVPNWIQGLAQGTHDPRVLRSARFVSAGRRVPPTWIKRRTPAWVHPLRTKLEREGLLPSRASLAS